jgi:hypothetical protein
VDNFFIEKYKLQDKSIVKPFYPGGNYQNEKYEENDVVIDNPPFSIITKIIRFYNENNIKFIVYGPALTIPGASNFGIKFLKHSSIEFLNGVKVPICFFTNLDTIAEMIDLDLTIPKPKKNKYDKSILTMCRISQNLKEGQPPINLKEYEIKKNHNGKNVFGGYFVKKS